MEKKDPKKFRIVSYWPLENHRGDFETCPECGAKFENLEWMDHAVIMVNAEVQGKHDSVGIVSECPECFEKSWVHQHIPFSSFNHLPEEWSVASGKEYNRRNVEALRDWKKGLCGECFHLQDGVATTHAWRSCIRGSGPVQISCDLFKYFKNKAK